RRPTLFVWAGCRGVYFPERLRVCRPFQRALGPAVRRYCGSRVWARTRTAGRPDGRFIDVSWLPQQPLRRFLPPVRSGRAAQQPLAETCSQLETDSRREAGLETVLSPSCPQRQPTETPTRRVSSRLPGRLNVEVQGLLDRFNLDIAERCLRR